VGVERDIFHLLRLLSAVATAGFLPTRTIPRARRRSAFIPSTGHARKTVPVTAMRFEVLAFAA
jgi:hypothetical protein